MGIFSDNPVLEREVRGRLRLKRKSDAQKHRWIVWLLGLVVAYFYLRGLVGIWRGTVQDARDFWPLLVYGALTLIVLLAPALASTAITQEREQQTWENLATTQLSGTEILLGKWLGRQMVPWLLLVILLPLMVVCVTRASLGLLMLPVVLGFLLVTIGCYSALGLLCSFQAKRTMTATAVALTLTVLLCIGTVIVSQVLNLFFYHGYTSQDSPVLWANPFYVLASLLTRISPDYTGDHPPQNEPYTAVIFFYFALSLAVTAAALRLMVVRYGRSVSG